MRHDLRVIRVRPRGLALPVVALACVFAAAGCGSTPSSSPFATPPAPGLTPALSLPSTGPAGPTSGPSLAASPGFAFDPESIVGYFESIGFACTARQPSTTASGHEFQSCQLVDADGRTRTLGIVTDSDDNVADAFLSVRGTDAEAILDPAAVLDPFASFLGAFLGERQGTAMLPWLAANLGDSEARTTVGDLTIATYTPSPDDHTKFTLEIASQAYLDAPSPSGAPVPSGAAAPGGAGRGPGPT